MESGSYYVMMARERFGNRYSFTACISDFSDILMSAREWSTELAKHGNWKLDGMKHAKSEEEAEDIAEQNNETYEQNGILKNPFLS